jgi:Flp pilus assembly protein TadD
MGRVAEAGAYYRKSVQLNARYVRGLDNLAMWLIQRGELSEAVGYIRDFLRVTDGYPAKVRPDNTSVHYQLGCALLSLGRLDDAMEQFRLVLDRQPSHEGAAKGLEQASARHKAAATRPATLRSVK